MLPDAEMTFEETCALVAFGQVYSTEKLPKGCSFRVTDAISENAMGAASQAEINVVRCGAVRAMAFEATEQMRGEKKKRKKKKKQTRRGRRFDHGALWANGAENITREEATTGAREAGK
ncbi:hypothetical protein N0V90_012575 [Kalmusia sp. IMI 367209]|nr:hypothetical protein N0V90_012575 [Kalmusia sp. IMI 367209]